MQLQEKSSNADENIVLLHSNAIILELLHYLLEQNEGAFPQHKPSCIPLNRNIKKTNESYVKITGTFVI